MNSNKERIFGYAFLYAKTAIKSRDKAAIKSVQLQLMEIMVYAASRDEFKTSDIEDLFKIKSSRARELIGILVRKGQIEASKGRKYRTYRSKV